MLDRIRSLALASAVASVGLTWCGAACAADEARDVALMEIGRQAFFDTGLSASGKLSCATCHDPAHAFAPANHRPVQLGGVDGRQQGGRSAPSLRYLQGSFPFVERHFADDDGGSDDADATPAGGLTWDGRVDTLHDQARLPLFDPREMANSGAADLSARLQAAPYAGELRRIFGSNGQDVFEDPQQLVGSLARALEAYQRSVPEFQPFSSKYDAYLRGRVRLSAQERHGLAVFDSPEKGNCASCHPDTVSPRGALPVFTDFSLVAIGAPRNRQLRANRDPAHVDLGLCGPERVDLARHTEFCGAFATPTLRNVATRHSFLHNGVFHSLRQVIEFYVWRDLDPARWYPRDAAGRVLKFDDLPAAYRDNVNADVPFKPAPGGRPRLNERDIDDLIAFLKTLTDGDAASQNPAAQAPRARPRVGLARHP